MPLSPALVSIKDAATALSISPWTVRKYVAKGIIQSVRIGRRVLIQPAEIDALIQRNRRRGAL